MDEHGIILGIDPEQQYWFGLIKTTKMEMRLTIT